MPMEFALGYNTVTTLGIGTDRLEKTSVDPDQMLQNVASDQGLHCSHSSSIILGTSTVSKIYIFFFQI